MTDMKFSIHDTRVLSDGFFKMIEYTVSHSLFKGGVSQQYSREVLERGDAVAIFLHDAIRDEVVLVEQFRAGAIHTPNPWLVELVAGIIEPGEDAPDVARRESKEECGADVTELEFVCHYFNSAGGSTETTSVFYAQIDASNIEGIHGLENENEDIRVSKVRTETFIQKLDNGHYKSGSLVLAGYWFKSQRLQGKFKAK